MCHYTALCNVKKLKQYSETCTIIVINRNSYGIVAMLKYGENFLTVK